MTKCAVCGKRMVGGYEAGTESFCSLRCYTHSPIGTFCAACLAATSEQSPGETFEFEGIGTRLSSARDRCPSCHSIVQRKAFWVVFIPILPLGTYRIIYTGRRQCIGRRLVAHVSKVPAAVAPR